MTDPYSITKEIRIHHEDGWHYEFLDDGDGCIVISSYEGSGIAEDQTGTLHIPKDNISQFIHVLEQLK